MFDRSHLLVAAVAILGTALGLFVAMGTGGGTGGHPVPPSPDVAVLKIGDARTDLQLAGLDGKSRRLSEFDGKPVLLNFWASWCGPCREEMPLLDALHEKRKDLIVVGVAIDDAGAVREFLKENPVRYPILIASEDSDASLRYGDTQDVLPYSVLIGRDGKILARRAGNFTEARLNDWLRPYL